MSGAVVLANDSPLDVRDLIDRSAPYRRGIRRRRPGIACYEGQSLRMLPCGTRRRSEGLRLSPWLSSPPLPVRPILGLCAFLPGHPGGWSQALGGTVRRERSILYVYDLGDASTRGLRPERSRGTPRHEGDLCRPSVPRDRRSEVHVRYAPLAEADHRPDRARLFV